MPVYMVSLSDSVINQLIKLYGSGWGKGANVSYEQEPIIRSMQLPHIPVTAFS